VRLKNSTTGFFGDFTLRATNNDMENKTITCFLKLNEGLFTRLTPVPRANITSEYRVPLLSPLNTHALNLAQPILDGYKKTPVLVFRAKGQILQGHPVLELISIENY
jgi:hypothetical protein